MDDEIFSRDINEPDNNHYGKIDIGFSKLNLSFIRIIICSFILIILALFKYFDYTNYEKFGVWYNNQLKTESLSTATVKNLALDKFKSLQEIIKDKINNL